MKTNTQTQVVSLTYREARTYWLASLFVLGNVVLPQLCHLVPQGGLTWLPIYFFTLIAAYKYGLLTGLLTAVISPIANHLLFGMPPAPMLPIILIKSGLLAVFASLIARRTGRVSLAAIALTILAYQFFGTLAEWMLTSSLPAALQDLRIGWPGLLLQLFGGYALLSFTTKTGNKG